VNPGSALATDFYQLTMAHAYFALGMRDEAVFELFVRRLPASRRFLLAVGLEQVVEYLERWRFTSEEIEFLARLGGFPDDFLAHLAGVRFTGTLHAMAEGTPFFANEPVLRVTAPILEAQLLESRLLNLVHFQTVIASKAARCVFAARGRRLVDFGMRRAHGSEAAVLASRAAWIAGFDATATVEAGRAFGIPLSGTMAHSFVEAHDHELDALRNFLRVRGGGTTLLIDTYDTERAAHRVAQLARESRASAGPRIGAVRIDSGDLAAQAFAVRRILDEHGCRDIEIVVSGNLDEARVAELLAAVAPVDGFGIGTHLDVAIDAPALDMAYKLQEYAGRARRKRSPGKQTWPGAKQVFRTRDERGRIARDCIALAGEPMPGEPLLREVMREGKRRDPAPALGEIRAYCRAQLAGLGAELTELSEGAAGYRVDVSSRVRGLAAQLDAHGE
jgi:nicotinate phosphoribosyltransferase